MAWYIELPGHAHCENTVGNVAVLPDLRACGGEGVGRVCRLKNQAAVRPGPLNNTTGSPGPARQSHPTIPPAPAGTVAKTHDDSVPTFYQLNL